jgi:endo-1,4-beta-xylanase
MKHHYTLLIIALVLCSNLSLFAQQEPVVVQAQSGNLGVDWEPIEEDGITYITSATDFISGTHPGSADKIASYEITFPEAGTYDLYLRFRVGPGADNDDSFFLANGFGEKSPTTDADWLVQNNLHEIGHTADNELVTGGGGARTEVWKWLNISERAELSFTVEADNLTRILQIGGREDGFDIDRVVFGLSDLYFTVSNLENAEAGSEEEPQAPGQEPIAVGQDKWLGNIYSPRQAENFADYWNQVTPENAGKWGSVERNRDNMNWTQLDAAYNLAKDNGFPFRFHVLIWGNQQPNWMENLSAEEQLEEIREWFAAVAERYPDIDYLEVVNEPLHDPPAGGGNGNYIDALGGTGDTGWDWVLNSFRLAREYFPNTPLMINEYNIINNNANSVSRYLEIIELLQAEDLIDIIGFQAHAFSTRSPADVLAANLERLAATGLPIQVTEMDIDGPELTQLRDYQRKFPVFWEHESVMGVTLWGWKAGMWREDQDAILMEEDGTERLALRWLKAYVRGEWVEVSDIHVNADQERVELGNTLQLAAQVNPEEATIPELEWSVMPVPGSEGRATIDQDGLLTTSRAGTVIVTAKALDGSGTTGTREIEIFEEGQPTSVDVREFANLKIYPNPALNGHFSIEGDKAFQQLSVMDLRGNKVHELNIGGQSTFEVQMNVAPGLYLIKLSDGQNTSFSKILVK